MNVAPPGVEEMLKEPGPYEIDTQTGLLVHVHGSNGIDTRVRSCSTISPTFSADSIRLPSYCQSFGRKENISQGSQPVLLERCVSEHSSVCEVALNVPNEKDWSTRK